MIHFLRNKHNKTIVDLEASKEDVHCSIDIKNYTMYLIENILIVQWPEFASDIDELAEIRGEWWETKHPEDKTPDDLAKRRCKEIGEKWGLIYITD